jgi:hypothetical protein
MTFLEVGNRFQAFDKKYPAIDFFACQHPVEDSSEGILAENADHNGRICLREGVPRPLHQIREIVDKAGFDQVF